MPAPKTAQDILVTEPKEIRSAERQLSRAVPKRSRSIVSEALRTKLQERREHGAQIIEEHRTFKLHAADVSEGAGRRLSGLGEQTRQADVG